MLAPAGVLKGKAMARARILTALSIAAATTVLIAGCAERRPPATEDKMPETASPLTVSANGYGPATIGMTPEEASQALGRPLLPLNAEEDEACSYVFPDGDVDAAYAFMTAHGRIVRIDVDQPGLATDAGAEVGDSEADALARYPQAEVQPHKYGDAGDHYLVIPSADGTRALILETWDGEVSYIRAGRLPEAAYVEGCS